MSEIPERGRIWLQTFGGLRLLESGNPVAQFGAKRLTFLAVLAAAGSEGIPKERLASLLWPESDAERARAALSQLAYVFRQVLGTEAIEVGATYIRLNERLVTSDVAEFRRAIELSDASQAFRLQREPFLAGVNAGDSVTLERWIDDMRAALRHDLIRLAEKSFEKALALGKFDEALPLARQLFSIDRADPRNALRVMRVLAESGDIPGALRIAEQHESWQRTELELPADERVLAFAQQLSVERVARTPRPLGENPSAQSVLTPSENTLREARRDDGFFRPWHLGIGAMMLVFVIVVGIVLQGDRSVTGDDERATADLTPPVLAILPFQVTAPDSSLDYLSEGMIDLLGAKLGDGVRGAEASAVVRAVESVSDGSQNSGDRVSAVAKATNAAFVVTGSMVASEGSVTLDATIYDVSNVMSPSTINASGPRDSLLTLVDRLAIQLLSLAARESAARLPTLQGTAIGAVREYLVGRKAFRDGAYQRAIEHLQLAIAEDSTFALAALDLVRVSGWLGESSIRARARRLAWQSREKLGAQDRVLYNAIVGPNFPNYTNGREKIRLWERVTQFFPTQPDAWFELADQLFHGAAFLDDPSIPQRVNALLAASLTRDSMFGPALTHAIQHAARFADTASLRQLELRLRSAKTDGDGTFLRWRIAAARNDSETLAQVRASLPSTDARSLTSIALSALNDGIYPADAERALVARMNAAGRVSEREDVLVGLHAVALNRGQLRQAMMLLTSGSNADAENSGVVFLKIFDAILAGGDTVLAMRAVQQISTAARIANTFALPTGAALSADTARAIEVARSSCAAAAWEAWRAGSQMNAPPTASLRRLATMLGNLPVASEAQVCALLLDAWWRVVTRAADADAARLSLDSAVQTIPSMGTLFESTLALNVANVHALAGDNRRALAAVRRQGYHFKWPHYRAEELRIEGRLALSSGDTAGAIRAYRSFLALRDAPDSVMRHGVAEVRKTLAALERR